MPEQTPRPDEGESATPPPAGRRWWEEGEEPDYRATLANERTFLSWSRTSLALLAGALAVLRLSGVTPSGAPAGADELSDPAVRRRHGGRLPALARAADPHAPPRAAGPHPCPDSRPGLPPRPGRAGGRRRGHRPLTGGRTLRSLTPRNGMT
ncbi:DUF202 domain-containing protein [Streptacidiphilus fuscans]|uniref:DUF202 domain-containing protein n=1 Tax=Streptacidiphilus fuscans TaxID=2789292 RepID=A0A931FDE1_9ACTN|nr:DUF202 domain-containing protein [Streptacidiphilus fuscans]